MYIVKLKGTYKHHDQVVYLQMFGLFAYQFVENINAATRFLTREDAEIVLKDSDIRTYMYNGKNIEIVSLEESAKA